MTSSFYLKLSDRFIGNGVVIHFTTGHALLVDKHKPVTGKDY